MSGRRSANEATPRAFSTMLGVQHSAEEDAEKYQSIQTIGGHTFVVPPANRFQSKSAESKFASIAGGVDPIKFDATRFDNFRERLQVADKKEREACLQAIAVLYSQFLAKTFVASSGLDYAEMERMFSPYYVPTYDAALKAVGLRKPLWYRRAIFSTLENISRLPLETCTENRQTVMSFAEYYSLLWNYYTPFNVNAFINLCLAQSFIPNRELIDATVDYLIWRLEGLDASARKNPILFIGSRTGKFGHLLNETKRLPVPVVHVHDNPNTNPYLLMIPPNKQADFKPTPIVKMKTQAALEKYQPSIVLASDFSAHQDDTAMIRGFGCVREYMYFGMSNSYAEGNGWDTWGYHKYRTREDNPVPSYVRDGWVKVPLDFISRWMIHKNDSDVCMGVGSVTSFVRDPLRPSFKQALRWNLMRIKPFY